MPTGNSAHVEAFVNAYGGASVASIFKGMEAAGIPNNTALAARRPGS